jgi:hypothetical protein
MIPLWHSKPLKVHARGGLDNDSPMCDTKGKHLRFAQGGQKVTCLRCLSLLKMKSRNEINSHLKAAETIVLGPLDGPKWVEPVALNVPPMTPLEAYEAACAAKNPKEINHTLLRMSPEWLKAAGYRRASNKYRMVSRIDKPDWLELLARSLHRSVADFYFKSGPNIGKLDPMWADHYRRVYSSDKLEGVPEEVFKQLPGDFHPTGNDFTRRPHDAMAWPHAEMLASTATEGHGIKGPSGTRGYAGTVFSSRALFADAIGFGKTMITGEITVNFPKIPGYADMRRFWTTSKPAESNIKTLKEALASRVMQRGQTEVAGAMTGRFKEPLVFSSPFLIADLKAHGSTMFCPPEPHIEEVPKEAPKLFSRVVPVLPWKDIEEVNSIDSPRRQLYWAIKKLRDKGSLVSTRVHTPGEVPLTLWTYPDCALTSGHLQTWPAWATSARNIRTLVANGYAKYEAVVRVYKDFDPAKYVVGDLLQNRIVPCDWKPGRPPYADLPKRQQSAIGCMHRFKELFKYKDGYWSVPNRAEASWGETQDTIDGIIAAGYAKYEDVVGRPLGNETEPTAGVIPEKPETIKAPRSSLSPAARLALDTLLGHSKLIRVKGHTFYTYDGCGMASGVPSWCATEGTIRELISAGHARYASAVPIAKVNGAGSADVTSLNIEVDNRLSKTMYRHGQMPKEVKDAIDMGNGKIIETGWRYGLIRPVMFCAGDSQTANNLSIALGIPKITPSTSLEARDLIIRRFNESCYAAIVVTFGIATTGWRAPAETLVVFLDGFPDDPMVRAQVKGRVGR